MIIFNLISAPALLQRQLIVLLITLGTCQTQVRDEKRKSRKRRGKSPLRPFFTKKACSWHHNKPTVTRHVLDGCGLFSIGLKEAVIGQGPGFEKKPIRSTYPRVG